MQTIEVKSTDSSMKLECDVNINDKCTEAYVLMFGGDNQLGSIPIESDDLRQWCQKVLQQLDATSQS
jgi:hypothetical protein